MVKKPLSVMVSDLEIAEAAVSLIDYVSPTAKETARVTVSLLDSVKAKATVSSTY